MAEFLIQQWRLSVLRVRFDLDRRDPVVVSSLVAYTEGVPHALWTLEHDPEHYGIPDVGVPGRLRLPDDLVDAVGHSFAEDLTQETALWLRLMPPYGYLGAAPWEPVLVELLHRPVLRVPDRLPVVAESGPVWRAAVVVAAAPGSDWAPAYLEEFLNHLQSQMPTRPEVHVFADARTTEQTAGPAQRLSCWTRHAPPRVTAGHDPSWADWIRDGLGGAAVRTLHVVTDADFDHTEPMLLLPPDPARPDTARRFYSVDPLLQLTDAVGAATLSFGSPPGNPSDLATRMLADRVGRTRPGATLYSDLTVDPSGEVLASAHAYLADRHGDRPVPFHSSLFLYAQPEHVRAHLLEAWPEPEYGTTSPGDEILPSLPATPGLPLPDVVQRRPSGGPLGFGVAEEDEVPGWLAASQRYLSREWVQLARSSATAPGDAAGSAYREGAAEALAEIAAILEREGRA